MRFDPTSSSGLRKLVSTHCGDFCFVCFRLVRLTENPLLLRSLHEAVSDVECRDLLMEGLPPRRVAPREMRADKPGLLGDLDAQLAAGERQPVVVQIDVRDLVIIEGEPVVALPGAGERDRESETTSRRDARDAIEANRPLLDSTVAELEVERCLVGGMAGQRERS